MDTIRVGIRGVSGHLGRRLIQVLQRQEDMEFAFGLLREDRMKPEFLAILKTLAALGVPIKGQIAESLEIASACDVLVDATAPRASERTRAEDAALGIPMILQCSEHDGRLIVPPLVESTPTPFWRQGDCLLTGLVPVITPFAEQLVHIRADVVMQFARSLDTYPMVQRIAATYLTPSIGAALSDGMKRLFPAAEVKTHVRQVPGLDYYTAHLELALDREMTRDCIVEKLTRMPRVCLLPSGVTSTYAVDHLIRESVVTCGRDLSPITVFRDSIIPAEENRAFTIELDVAIYSRTIAVYGNIDAIRLIARPDMNPYDAMRATDAYAQLVTHVE